MSDTAREPVLWALDFGGESLHPDFVFTWFAEAENYKRHTISHCQIIPLFRDPPPPPLTDAEREAVATASWIAGAVGEDDVKATLRALLARLGGDA